jgi:hypothetical protein
MHPFAIGVYKVWYFNPIGYTEFNPANAPFLNSIKQFPFVVPPSGYIIKGGYNPFSHFFCHSEIWSIIALFSFLQALSRNKQPTASAILPIPGICLILDFATWLGGYLVAWIMISIQL